MTPNPQKSLLDGLVLRPAALPEDEDFLRELYFASRSDLEAMPVSDALKRNLLLMQYQAQSFTYAEQYPEASHEIVELEGHPIGRLMIARRQDAICVVDLALIPEKRNEGIGTALLRRVMGECSEKNIPCTLQVVITNPARSLYERLGFRVEDTDGVRLSMRWNS